MDTAWRRVRCSECGVELYRCWNCDLGVFDLTGTYIGRYEYRCPEYKKTQQLSCKKNENTQSFSRSITNYQCFVCGKSYQYKNAASSGCNICGGTHNVGAEGSQTGSHNAVASYLVCGY